MYTDFFKKFHHATDYFTPANPVQVDISRAMKELRALGYTVNHAPAPRDEDWLLEVYDGENKLFSAHGLNEVISLDALTELRRIIESKTVKNCLDKLNHRMANAGWSPHLTEDGRIRIEKSAGRTRTYSPTYTHLAEIKSELARIEFLSFILPRAQKLSQVIKDGYQMASSRWPLIRAELSDLGSRIIEDLAEPGPAVPDAALAEELARVFKAPTDSPEPPAEEVPPQPPLPDDLAAAIAVVQVEPDSAPGSTAEA